ncbi:MAG: M48 family metallopeptidase [Pseudomonadota bacterium]
MTAARVRRVAGGRFCVGADAIPVQVRRNPRARRLTLRLAADTGAVSLTAPARISDRQIRGFLDAHADWIETRRAALPPRVEPRPGLTLAVAGQGLTLAPGPGRSVRRQGDRLLVPGIEEAAFRRHLRRWLVAQARQAAAAACARYATPDRPMTKLTMRDPRTRWGSCTSAGHIMLSWRLILAPPAVLNYVAAHEVAHLHEMHHGPAFWRRVHDIHGDYDAPRAWLRAHGAALHRVVV